MYKDILFEKTSNEVVQRISIQLVQKQKYTKDIIENFDKFEQEEKQSIKNGLYFISSNQKDKYFKSSNIYLSQDLTDYIFNNNSISLALVLFL